MRLYKFSYYFSPARTPKRSDQKIACDLSFLSGSLNIHTQYYFRIQSIFFCACKIKMLFTDLHMKRKTSRCFEDTNSYSFHLHVILTKCLILLDGFWTCCHIAPLFSAVFCLLLSSKETSIFSRCLHNKLKPKKKIALYILKKQL